jgi:aromatic ring-opening dioxygenase catalytic subunit (LigB family)
LETDREYSELSQEIVAMRSELTLLLLSDNALHREELQEEAKVLYQEWRRLQDSAFEKQIAISDAKKELDDALDEEGAVMYDRQAKQIVELSEKLARYEHANRKLAHKIKKLKAEREQAVVGGGRQEIARQIENVEKETLDIEERIRSAKENHQKVMSSLRASLRAAGVAQEDTT